MAMMLAGGACSNHDAYENVGIFVGDHYYRATVINNDANHRTVVFPSGRRITLGGGPEYDSFGKLTGKRLLGLDCEGPVCRGWDSEGTEWDLDYRGARLMEELSGDDAENEKSQPLPAKDLGGLQAQAKWCMRETFCVDLYNGSGWGIQEISISIKRRTIPLLQGTEEELHTSICGVRASGSLSSLPEKR